MDKRKLMILAIVVAIITIAGLVASQRALTSTPSKSSPRPSLFETASTSPGAETNASAPVTAKPTATSTSSPSPAPVQLQTADPGPVVSTQTQPAAAPNEQIERTNPDDDLYSSRTRLDAIDHLSAEADDLFAAPSDDEPTWTVNQQDMDQQDYESADGNNAITKWYSHDEYGNGVVQAEEAQLANGEVVDRWYDENGNVQQVIHQYDKNNSYSVYRYPNGQVEATRVIKDGTEIFTKYDQDGRQIQRTITPATPN